MSETHPANSNRLVGEKLSAGRCDAQYVKPLSPQYEKGLGDHLTKSMPISAPGREAKAAATTVSTGIRNVMFQFMVMLALYNSVLTRSAWLRLGQWAASVVRISWGGELRTAATLIPASLRGSLLPVELSERRTL